MNWPIGELAGLGGALLWATTSIFFTAAGRLAHPVATNLFKTTAATLLFAITLLIRDGTPWGTGIAPRDVWLLVGSGVLGLTLGDSLLFLGYQAIGTRRAMLIQATNPILGAIGGWLFLSEHLGWKAIVGMLVALGGTAVVVSDHLPPMPDGRRRKRRVGVLLGFGAAFGQASGALLARAALENVPTVEATQIRVAGGAAALFLLGLFSGQLLRWIRELLFQRAVLWRVSLASVLGPFVAIWLMLVSLTYAPTGVALTLLSMGPIFLLPMGALFQKDVPSARETLGAIVAIGGVALLVMR